MCSTVSPALTAVYNDNLFTMRGRTVTRHNSLSIDLLDYVTGTGSYSTYEYCLIHTASDDLLDVLKQLTTLNRSKFWNLGLELGLKPSTLDNLQHTSTKDEFWQNVILAWLNQEDNVKPSWRSLIDALESEFVLERPIAQQIRSSLGIEEETHEDKLLGKHNSLSLSMLK